MTMDASTIGTTSLDPLLAPRSVAVIGASGDVRRFGGRPVQYMLQAGFKGPLHAVNPGRAEVQGIKAVPSLYETAGPIDCAIIAVGADDTVNAVSECARRGVRSAILFAAGFAEVGPEGAALQQRIVDIAREANMRLLGPNCMGAFNATASFYATFASALEEGLPAQGDVGLVSQSGGYGGYVLKHAFRRNIGLSKWVTTGNECDVEFGELLHWMVDQPDVRVIVGYIEGVRSKAKLVAALERAQRVGKPVVVMKVGRTAEGRVAAASHTASMTGEDEIYDALFQQYGVLRARTTDELLDMAYALSRSSLPTGRRVAVVSISGGIGVQVADYLSDAGLTMPRTPQSAAEALREIVPYCSPMNPIDMTGTATTNPVIMEQTVDRVLASEAFDALIIFIGIAGLAPSSAAALRDAITAAAARHAGKLILISITTTPEMVKSYEDAGLLVFEDPYRAVVALAALTRFASGQAQGAEIMPAAPPLEVTVPRGDGNLNEADAKALIAQCGIRSPREMVVPDGAAGAAAAAEIGFPVAVKVVSADIPHKTDVGGVALGLGNEAAVRDAIDRMAATIPEKVDGATIDGYLVSEMVSGGAETIVGINRDPVFGPVVTFGLGGSAVELVKDISQRLAPLSLAEAQLMMRELRTFPLLDGYRGAQPLDTEALARALVSLSMLAVENEDRLESLEINPLVVRPAGQGLVALDAVVRLQSRDGETGAASD